MTKSKSTSDRSIYFAMIIVAVSVIVAVALVARQNDPAAPAPIEPVRATASAPPPASSTPSATMNDIERIDARSAKKLLDSGAAIIIDVRDIESFKLAHIPGALQIPLEYVQGEIPYFPRDRKILTYCTCPAEESSGAASIVLHNGGLTNTAALLGGLDAWKAAGFPIETGLKETVGP